MKRFYLFVLLVMVSLPVPAKNKISMVTYFPVPYVAYSQVNTTEQMDIGLTSACDMKLGCSESSATLNAARVNLNGGKLNLDGGRGIKGYTLNLGSGYGDGKISFQNVRIQTGNMESVNAADMKADNLNLFGKAFPSCKAANSESGGQMQWASLKLKGASSSELYLACGGLGSSSGPEPPSSTKTCSLEEPQLTSQTYKALSWGHLLTPEGTKWIDFEPSEFHSMAIGEGTCSSGAFGSVSYRGSASCDGQLGTGGDFPTFDELYCENENLVTHGENLTCNECFTQNGLQYIIQLHCEYTPAGTSWECPADSRCGVNPGSCL